MLNVYSGKIKKSLKKLRVSLVQLKDHEAAVSYGGLKKKPFLKAILRTAVSTDNTTLDLHGLYFAYINWDIRGVHRYKC